MTTTNVTIILDKSGSMDSVREATISGLNEYLGTLAKDENHYHISLTLFDTEVKHLWQNEILNSATKLAEKDYQPDGMTALYDAVCSTLKKANSSDEIKNIVVIMTDGFENSSKEYTQVQMKKIVKDLEAKGNWTFVYMGANQDAYAEAAKYGIHRGNAVNFNATDAGMGSTFVAQAAATMRTASMSQMSNTKGFYSAEEQKKVEETK
jgi:hypothetical protein